MPVVFFEGFNYNNGDLIKLDPKYWSFNNPITFNGVRTGNGVYLSDRPFDSGLSLNSTLTLSNFTDPLSISNGFGIGFCLGTRSIMTRRTDYSSPPHNENLISFYDNSNSEVLRLDIIKTSGTTYGDSIGIGVYQNSTLVDTYDFKSHIGYTWPIVSHNSAYLINANSTFVEIYIDAKNQQKISIKFSGNTTYNAPLRNNNNQFETTINGFNSLKSLKFYSKHLALDYGTSIDDLYISAGNSASEALLGQNTKIYRVGFNQNFSPIQWSSMNGADGTQYYYLNSNDGDASYALSSTSGNVSIFELDNLSSTPNNVGGIKIDNIARSSDPASGWKMVNVLSSGGTIIDDTKTYEISSTTYTNNDTFIFTNPITGSGWTLSDINNLKIGVKNLGAYSP